MYRTLIAATISQIERLRIGALRAFDAELEELQSLRKEIASEIRVAQRQPKSNQNMLDALNTLYAGVNQRINGAKEFSKKMHAQIYGISTLLVNKDKDDLLYQLSETNIRLAELLSAIEAYDKKRHEAMSGFARFVDFFTGDSKKLDQKSDSIQSWIKEQIKQQAEREKEIKGLKTVSIDDSTIQTEIQKRLKEKLEKTKEEVRKLGVKLN